VDYQPCERIVEGETHRGVRIRPVSHRKWGEGSPATVIERDTDENG